MIGQNNNRSLSYAFIFALLCSNISTYSAETVAISGEIVTSVGATRGTVLTPLLNKKMFIYGGLVLLAAKIYWTYFKDRAKLSPEDSLLTSLKNARTLKEFFDVFDRWFIGRPEKPSSLKVNAEGYTKFAHELVVTMQEGEPAYGLCGITWSYIKTIYDSLKAIKDLHDTAEFFEITK